MSFLIADFSGRVLVRFGTPAPGVPGPRREGTEQAETAPLAGTVYDRVLRTQQVDVHELAEGAQLTVPVTDWGDAVGVIELILPWYPDEQVVADVACGSPILCLHPLTCRILTEGAHATSRPGSTARSSAR